MIQSEFEELNQTKLENEADIRRIFLQKKKQKQIYKKFRNIRKYKNYQIKKKLVVKGTEDQYWHKK